jgi:hypothetical protein
MRWYGIDFSGNHDQWKPQTRHPNVWIATVEDAPGGKALTGLRPVQDLPEHYGDHPFERLIAMLHEGDFAAAGIDAPFSIPHPYASRYASYAALLEAVRALPCEGRPFARGATFVAGVTGQEPPLSPPKPMRQTDQHHGVNVRSTLWNGARGGAPMTAACMTLLARAQRPLWPWAAPAEPGLLVEAFPAAQLHTWGLPSQKYEGADNLPARQAIARGLYARLRVPQEYLALMLANADALDAVVCAFAAIAVTENKLLHRPDPAVSDEEGWIAVHA